MTRILRASLLVVVRLIAGLSESRIIADSLSCLNRGSSRITRITRIEICNIKLSAKRTVFCFIAMLAEVLTVRRCLLATEYRFSAQNLQRLRYRYGMQF